MNILILGDEEIPLPQLEPLLKDFCAAYEDVGISYFSDTHFNIQAVVMSIKDIRKPIEMAWDEIDVVMLAGDKHQELIESVGLKVPVLDLTNWLMPLNLDYRCE